jgi:hypothetical protein
VVVALAGYPKAAARAIFSTRRRTLAKKGGLDSTLIERIREHLGSSYDFDFSAALSPHQNLQYLAGMLHYAKLRAALLEQYDV